MVIDEDRKFPLTKFSTINGQKEVKESDHNILMLVLKLKWRSLHQNSNQRKEIFNFRNKDDFQMFKNETEENPELLQCFHDMSDLNSAANRWLKILNDIIRKCFKKVRLGKTFKNVELENLFEKKERIMTAISQAGKEEIELLFNLNNNLEDTSEQIASICATKNKEIVNEYLGKNQDTTEGFSQIRTYNLKKRLCPKNSLDPPTAKRNSEGKLVSDPEELKTLYMETYAARLKPNAVPDSLKKTEELKNELFSLRLAAASKEKSDDWTLEQLEKVLKSTKNDKARDAHGHVYEIFKEGGKSLKISLLKLFNLTRRSQEYPDILQLSDITSIYKMRGKKDDLNSDRGVFNVVKIRSLLDKLIYNDKYQIIDDQMSNSNIGGRKNRNVRDHLFVINGVMNDAIQNNENIDIQIMDVSKCFDKMNFKETANDLYEAGVTDDQFVTVVNSNKKCQVSVKVPGGAQTKRMELNEIEMQGTVLAPLKCSVQIDTLGKECLRNNEGTYKYKGCTSIPPLSFIDDVLGITKCSVRSVQLNALIQSKMNHKKLQLNQTKCFKMHVGKSTGTCPQLKVDGREMVSVEQERYLGDILTSSGKINENIEERFNKGLGKINDIMSMLNEVSFGHYFFEMALMFRQSMLINSILCNVEVLYGITKTHVEKLEAVDKTFMRRIFQSPVSTPIESFFIETNVLPLRFVIMARRIMYYHTLLQKPDSELAKTVFLTQQKLTVKNDWINLVKDDLQQCQITLSESDIKHMKKEKFKKLVNEKIRNLSDDYLLNLQQSHSKSSKIYITENIKSYLICEELSLAQKRMLFLMRNQMCDVKTNYSTHYKHNMKCRLCDKDEESIFHLLVCDELLDENLRKEARSINPNDVWSSLNRQKITVEFFNKIFKIRNMKYEMKKLSFGTQVNPTFVSSSCTAQYVTLD